VGDALRAWLEDAAALQNDELVADVLAIRRRYREELAESGTALVRSEVHPAARNAGGRTAREIGDSNDRRSR
jgi:hypothetical protein